MPKEFFEISWATLWRVFIMLLFVMALFLARESLIILFLAIIISSALDRPVSYLQEKKIPRILGTLFIFLAALIILAMLLYTFIPIAIFEFQNLLEGLKNIELPVLGNLDISHFIQLDKYAGSLGNFANALFSGSVSLFNFIGIIFGNLVLIIATFVLSFYLTVDQFGVEKFLRTILPINYEDYVIEIYFRARKKIGQWLQGQVFLMLIVGVITSVGLWLLGVKYALVLGILAGLLEIVPMVGPIFSGAIAFLVAVPQSLTLGMYVILLFMLIQQAEGHLLVPLVMRKAVGINPVVVVVALLAGWDIAGVLGAILAVPVAVIFQEIVDDWERRKLKTGRLLSND